ncbi:MAG: slr1659 superfamily regulator [Pseudanabaena sp.]
MEVKAGNYKVWYEPSEFTIYCQGYLRLVGTEEYAPIVQILEYAIEQVPPQIILNLCQLEFLNSSGINVLSKFVIKVRQKEKIQIIVKGSETIPWQGKSLKNLQRLMPALTLAWS